MSIVSIPTPKLNTKTQTLTFRHSFQPATAPLDWGSFSPLGTAWVRIASESLEGQLQFAHLRE